MPHMPPTASPRPSNEAFSRIKIDSQLQDVRWNLIDGRSARYEVGLPDGTKADYVLADRNGRSIAVIEAKRASVNPVAAESQGLRPAATGAVHLPVQWRRNLVLGMAARSAPSSHQDLLYAGRP